jgi:hypothetical protein
LNPASSRRQKSSSLVEIDVGCRGDDEGVQRFAHVPVGYPDYSDLADRVVSDQHLLTLCGVKVDPPYGVRSDASGSAAEDDSTTAGVREFLLQFGRRGLTVKGHGADALTRPARWAIRVCTAFSPVTPRRESSGSDSRRAAAAPTVVANWDHVNVVVPSLSAISLGLDSFSSVMPPRNTSASLLVVCPAINW